MYYYAVSGAVSGQSSSRRFCGVDVASKPVKITARSRTLKCSAARNRYKLVFMQFRALGLPTNRHLEENFGESDAV